MRIAPANYNTNAAKSKMQNFKGLWGKTSISTDYDIALGVPSVRNTYYYYPYSNESEEQINKVVDDNQSAYIDDRNGFSRYIVNECRVCYTLPFDEKKYDDYMSVTGKDKLSKTTVDIHKHAKDKFLTNKYGNNQTTAANDVVSAKLLNSQV